MDQLPFGSDWGYDLENDNHNAPKNLHIFDLSYPATRDMPLYPGTEAPVIGAGCSIEESGFVEKKITFFSHTGTHVDAPE